IEDYLSSLLCGDKDYSVIFEAANCSLLAGGKRLRPALLLEFYGICSGDTKKALPFAAAIEMIHTYSLIHDDLHCMDNDDLRRGRPSCHKQFSEDTALLAGDALLTEAFDIACTAEIDNSRKVSAIKMLAECAGINGMIAGQVLDLQFETKAPNKESLLKMYSLKTGKLLKAACTIGCILGGADEIKINAAQQFAENLGIAFQIKDDILDIESTEDVLGKPIGSDKDSGKTTYVSLVGLSQAKKDVVYYTEKAKEALSAFNADTSELIEIADYLVNRIN
ncbi:MAG: polyprenyl synthetase family protein, partial [Oscillospiraceae bacterium]|nr:polyprenyl synthetase family protein [Candidatus Equicaccousia limihippi]